MVFHAYPKKRYSFLALIICSPDLWGHSPCENDTARNMVNPAMRTPGEDSSARRCMGRAILSLLDLAQRGGVADDLTEAFDIANQQGAWLAFAVRKIPYAHAFGCMQGDGDDSRLHLVG